MNGHVLEELPIAVDFFKTSDVVQLHFLTHAHCDHTVGLTKSWNSKIYCTETTARLVSHKLGVRFSWFVLLEEMQPYIFKIKRRDEWDILTVTPLPAYHCPGSCMFIFETESVKVLYTGDFKPNEKMLKVLPDTVSLNTRPVDVMYVDNTYAEPACVLPKQEEAIDEIVEICKTHNDCTIFIGVYWTGHEGLLKTLSVNLDLPIVVKAQHFKVLQLLGETDEYTTDTYASDLRALPMNSLSKRFMSEMNEVEKSIAIIPTGRLCDKRRGVFKDEFIFSVPYSHHPSYSELREFIDIIRPGKILPIVRGLEGCVGMESSRRADMSQFYNLPRSSSENANASMSKTYKSTCCRRKRPPKTSFRRKSKTVKALGVVFDDD